MGERPTNEAFLLTINNADDYREAFQAAQAEAWRARASEEAKDLEIQTLRVLHDEAQDDANAKSAELKAAHAAIHEFRERAESLKDLLDTKDVQIKALEAVTTRYVEGELCWCEAPRKLDGTHWAYCQVARDAMGVLK